MDNHLYREISKFMGNREITYTRVSMKEMDELIEEWNSLERRAFY
jgi:hypothetical protein